MSERARIAFLTGCMFIVGLNLESAARLLLEGWFGPYAGPELQARDAALAGATDASSASAPGAGHDETWTPGAAPGL